MELTPEPWADERARALERSGRSRPGAPAGPEGRLVVVDVELQRLSLIERDRDTLHLPVSTAAAGVGGEDGSLRTPPGWHRIHARLGAGAVPGTVFESREPTGRVWRGEADEADLILTRVLTLEGLEPGINRGPGVDSLERFVYLHGTNHEAALGTPASHGCVRLSNAGIAELFERVREGDPVLVAGEPAGTVPDPAAPGRFHYAGLGGSGMSALAQFQVMTGGRASGSDRAFDRGERAAARDRLERLGIVVWPQDGSGLDGDCAALVVSTAVEREVADFAAARRLAVPVVHRSELLARFVRDRRTLAVSGTSGKSTVVAMAWEILSAAGRDPSVITGGDLVRLQERDLWGNAWAGGSDLLVIEADESDGSLVRYEPEIGVILNLQRDHLETGEVARLFAAFRARTRRAMVVGEEPNLERLAEGATVFGFGPRAEVRATEVALDPDESAFTACGVRYTLPVPGRHNVANALAAIAACRDLGVDPAAMAAPLAEFRGVGRRFQILGTARGVEVVDDFAHNPAKLAAALATAHRRARRVLAVYQPHGFGPTRFLWDDLIAAFAGALAPEDRLWLLEVFYAGGTATRDVSAAAMVREIAARGVDARFASSRAGLVATLAAEARPGDLVLVMGARDPSLTRLARAVLERLGGTPTGEDPA